MTENEAIKELKVQIETAESMISYNVDFEPKHDNSVLENKIKTAKIAISALEEIQQYRAIGTVEECRAAMERKMAKKPKHFYKKYGKHKWRRKENGEIDDFAWEFDYHNGVSCEICGETVCVHCNPNYDELDDCEEKHWNCPNCGKRVGWKSKYCDCGQAIDWSDTN